MPYSIGASFGWVLNRARVPLSPGFELLECSLRLRDSQKQREDESPALEASGEGARVTVFKTKDDS